LVVQQSNSLEDTTPPQNIYFCGGCSL